MPTSKKLSTPKISSTKKPKSSEKKHKDSPKSSTSPKSKSTKSKKPSVSVVSLKSVSLSIPKKTKKSTKQKGGFKIPFISDYLNKNKVAPAPMPMPVSNANSNNVWFSPEYNSLIKNAANKQYPKPSSKIFPHNIYNSNSNDNVNSLQSINIGNANGNTNSNSRYSRENSEPIMLRRNYERNNVMKYPRRNSNISNISNINANSIGNGNVVPRNNNTRYSSRRDSVPAMLRD